MKRIFVLLAACLVGVLLPASAQAAPPTAPPAPSFSSVTTTAANVSWGESTDDVAVTGYYLQQLVGGGWTTIRTVAPSARFQSVTGLAPNTSYSFAVVAFDAQGNTSARSPAGVLTTLATTAAPACHAQVVSFSPGFIVTVTIVNTTTATLNGWTVGFALAPATIVGSVFSSVLTRSGGAATLTPVVWSATIAPGGQLFVGLTGSVTPFTAPGSFTLNGLPCTPDQPAW